MSNRPSREELFTLIWERPAEDIARDLGISGAALCKLCRRLQVPKPPRGYWARVRAGRIVRRPPLLAFKETPPARRLLKPDNPNDFIRLSERQRELVGRALRELRRARVDVGQAVVTADGVRHLADDIAARVVLLVQNSYRGWLPADVSERAVTAREMVAGALLQRLLPAARAELVVFRRAERESSTTVQTAAAIVRSTGRLRLRVARAHGVVVKNRLAFAAFPLNSTDFGWVAHGFLSRQEGATAPELCVSADRVWIRCRLSRWDGDRELLELESIPIGDLAPVELPMRQDVRLPTLVEPSTIRPYLPRLAALERAEQVRDIVSGALSHLDGSTPDDVLCIVERMMLGSAEMGPFQRARQAARSIEDEVERWDAAIETEQAEVAAEILGIRVGDTVIADVAGKVQRISVKHIVLYAHDGAFNFHISGARFRKDGHLGSRQEYIALSVPDPRARAGHKRQALNWP